MDWVECESVRACCPDFADVLLRGEAFEGLKTLAVIVGIDEVGTLSLQDATGPFRSAMWKR
jgi:hypothetical protein